MSTSRILRTLAASSALLGLAQATPALADASGVKIGVITDMSGSYADLSGKGSVVAAQMAVEEFGGKALGKPVTVLSADHQNKADIASSLARRWFDTDGVDMVIDFPNSSTALAVQEVARQKQKIDIVSTGGAMALTNQNCSPTGFHWAWDTYSVSYPLVRRLIDQGRNSWYYITVDYAFGQSLEADFRKAVDAGGGKNVGSTRHPLNASDFSSPVVAASASKAKVVVLANAGNDMINGVKAAGEFGLIKAGQTVITPSTFITDLKSLGLPAAQGLTYVDPFRLDLDAQSKDFVERYYKRHKAYPTHGQIGVYSGVLHYLKAVEAARTVEGPAVADKMRALPVNDAFVRNGKVRIDGRMVHDMYLAQAKTPAESKGPWDLVKYIGTIPGDEAFRPLSASECALVKK
ncbi:ABC transporter substrate-binding protein [Cupriavidus sp. AcVe19-6a]|uniref:ABC transporter substrate-binding protein n=1 Tax=Cupriavidus sp. AcVe19-6a TaxID=2821358 RepID=UPI001AE3A4E9|nr:ABC transporter substrate-binding protein [Cupriavidus sp. AcVe19-6a]MBP0636275.1 ABC transporter substrate-binding protein [Cupriavidus sp. AcVe19-6a]